MQTEVDLRYPVGKYQPKEFDETLKEQWLAEIRFLPDALEHAVLNLDEKQLQVPYRAGGWNIQQVVHHVADSHLNAYLRFKLAYTEENPTIKPYDEKLWAALADIQEIPINVSLTLLHALHQRWYAFLKHFSEKDWQKTLFHPGHQQQFTLWQMLGLYAWHGRHHTAHITGLKERMEWL